MSATIAWRMISADFLKIRKKRSTLLWALVLALLPMVLLFGVNAIQHSSDAAKHGPAGGIDHYTDALRLLGGLFFGPLVAILVGVEAGTSDLGAGMFRDMVVTGRSRVALFASRLPAGVFLCWTVVVSAYALAVLATFVFAGGLPTPSTALILNGLAFLLLATGVLCAVAIGFSSLIGSKPGAIIALIAWQIVASPLLSSITSLGSSRDAVLSQGVAHFSPVNISGDGHHGPTVITMGGATAAIVIIGWLAVFLGLGAWRTRTMDA